ncbi:MAG: ribbon-helix-helix protein, CopG family [Candidatus Xenobia bacterium]
MALQKRKIGTVLDGDLVERAREIAAAEGKSLAQVIEEALRAHVARRSIGESAVQRMRGVFKLSRGSWDEVLRTELYDS